MSCFLRDLQFFCEYDHVTVVLPRYPFLFLIIGRDAYLVRTLSDIQSKLDTLTRMVSRVCADTTPPQPELPDDISLPVTTEGSLDTVENALECDSSVKDSLVSCCLICWVMVIWVGNL